MLDFPFILVYPTEPNTSPCFKEPPALPLPLPIDFLMSKETLIKEFTDENLIQES
jgi:hypothetical protein